MKKRRLLIDADYLVYTMGYASEKKANFADGDVIKTPDLDLAKRLILKTVKGFLNLFETDDYVLVLSGKGNWRSEFYSEYKANRASLIKPLCYNEIRQWLMSLPDTVLVNGEEADDWLASRVTQSKTSEKIHSGEPEKGAIEEIIVSADKDFFTVPLGAVYNLSTKKLFRPTIPQAFSFLFFQAMAGDRVDGYYGVPWLGEAKSTRILQSASGKTVRQTYLFIKEQVFKRGKTLEEKKANWNHFRVCLDLAALRWSNETGSRGIGLRRVHTHRQYPFEYFLPYYDVRHNIKYGEQVEDLYQ